MNNFINAFSVTSFTILRGMGIFTSVVATGLAGLACIVLVFTAIGVAFFGSFDTAMELFFWSVISFVITVLSYMFFKWLDELNNWQVECFARKFAGQQTW